MPNGCRAPWPDRGARLRRQIGWCDARWALPGSRQNADQGAECRGPDIWWNPEPGTGNRAMWSQTLAAAGAATEARKIYRAVCLSCRQTSSKSDALARGRWERVQAEQLRHR